ncbi:prephenate/arogenate dehydrogenase family protein [Ahrensia sp. R2A130]|uniref:prephenate/arogenate dehydrogenase family protein n=1 Tax=Ahrensia sp. R2A130 TaxID=744979 RepID=UPI0001E0E8E9|nr:prephenate/arogenate dehydrogenase family protein [Ahrensia sp. R2A130]EFL88003.1 prephenate dehydrogenase [Ahrensia sp. R2A130]
MADTSNFQPFKRLALIGIGLIGSSIALRARRDGLADEIVICTRRAETLDKARELNLGDVYTDRVSEAVTDSDCVILCVPVGAFSSVGERMAGHLAPGAIVTDVGSVKRSVIDQLAPHIPDNVHLVPGHPIAGTEHSGPEAGFATLFDNRWQLLTPLESTDPEATERLAAFWRALGSQVDIMTPEHHDRVLAVTSHIPHLIAYNIVGTADDLAEITQSEVIKYSASGFRDFTRIAASDPVMWRDVFLHNKDATLEMLGRFSEDLAALQRAIRHGDGDLLFDHFTRTREIRRGIIEAGQETSEPNFGRYKTDS